jgi:hypothetical protein
MNQTLQHFLHRATKHFLPLSLIFLFLAALFIAGFDLYYTPLWTIGDWLVNYSAGFVRRGLPGEFFLLLSHLLHVEVPWIALVIPALVYAGFLVGVYRLANPLRRNFLWFAMLFSPATLPFIVLNGMDIGFRKETLLLASLALFIYMLQRNSRDLTLGCTLTVMFAVLVLSHEGTLICFPYFVAAMALVTGAPKRTVKVCALPLVVACVLFAIVNSHPGTSAQARGICQSVNGHWTELPPGKIYPGMNGENGLCAGSIAWIGKPLSLYKQQRAEANPLPVYALRIPFAFLPFGLALAWMYRKDKLRYEVVVVTGTALLCLLGSVGLFAAALDWGRWIYMQAVCLMLVTLLTAQRAQSFRPAEQDSATTSKQIFTSCALGLFTFLYCATWTVPTNSMFPIRRGYWQSARVIKHTISSRPMLKEEPGLGRFGEPK